MKAPNLCVHLCLIADLHLFSKDGNLFRPSQGVGKISLTILDVVDEDSFSSSLNLTLKATRKTAITRPI